MRQNININLIASMLTDDPDVFIEGAQPIKCTDCGTMIPVSQAQCEKCGKFKTAIINNENSKPKSSKKKKKSSNKPKSEKFDNKFKIHGGHEERKKPAKPGDQKRSSSLTKGPEGEQGSKSSPYLKSNK
jgi:hypothetical protein